MLVTSSLRITPEMLSLISEIDEFKGAWRALGTLAPERLSALRRVATIESIGSSTRIEGSKLSDREVERLLSNLEIKAFTNRDEQEVAGYAEVMETVFASWPEIAITENHLRQLHRDLLRYSEKDEPHRGHYKTASNSVAAFDAEGNQVGIVFETATPFDTPRLMAELLAWFNATIQDNALHPLLAIGIFVVVFLEIHPFQDGNGRLSRVLTTLLLLRAGYAYVPYSSLESIEQGILLSRAARHPGPFVRETIIPAGMSVTDAAKHLGIGRPALSNFLNGKSALSPEMAVRLEKTFGADRKGLLDMQAAHDRHEQRDGEKHIVVRAFVPNFLTIKARQIEGWADSQIDARTHLPVLLRKLVHSTGNNLRQVDFPGYDNAQRKGNDGFVEAGTATPWIPEGESYWEFGTDQSPAVKANKDYDARLLSVDASIRASSTFVFVTPRNWPAKTVWEKQKNAAHDWKAVRAFDASDIEQWLEQSVPAQIWFAEQIALPISGYEALDQAWYRWADASEPPLTPEIFVPSIAAYSNCFKEWLDKPNKRPFVVAADSQGEALAFLACLFDDPEFRLFKDLAAVFTDPVTLRTLVASSVAFIPT